MYNHAAYRGAACVGEAQSCSREKGFNLGNLKATLIAIVGLRS